MAEEKKQKKKSNKGINKKNILKISDVKKSVNNKKNSKKNKKNDKFIKKFKKKYNNFKSSFSVFKKNNKVSYSFKEVMIIMLFSLGLGFFACLSFVNIFSNSRDYKLLSKDLKKFVDTYSAIKSNFYGDFDVDSVVEAAIQGMVGAVGDEYTSYSDNTSTDDFMDTVTGVYEGIGCTVSMNLKNEIVVIDMFDNSPAVKAGLEIGDIIVKIDGVDYTGKNSTDMSNYVKNSKKSEVELLVLRNDIEVKILIKREKIEIPYVEGKVIESSGKKIGYVNISLFSSVVNKQFKDKLLELENSKIDSLVIDVRGNSGGYLSSVTDIINMFLEKGDIIYQLKDNNGVDIKKDTTKEKRDYSIAVLIDAASASASEILAAAIKESYGGYVVGVNSYGKGTVQQTTTFTDGSMVKYTIQNWLTPSGLWINEEGVEPTDYVKQQDSYYKNPVYENDLQLQKAVELLVNENTSN